MTSKKNENYLIPDNKLIASGLIASGLVGIGMLGFVLTRYKTSKLKIFKLEKNIFSGHFKILIVLIWLLRH